MFVDIHTHNIFSSNALAIRNITLLEAESFLLEQEKGLFSIGLHPWYADTFSAELFKKLEIYAADKRCVAIGECGLDKNSKVGFAHQVFVFNKQIRLSDKLQKPIIIHCVKSYDILFDLKKALRPKQLWIIHGFRGKPELAKQALKLGIALSFGERYNEESVRVTPLDKLFIETDESKLPIEEIYQGIAKIKGCETKELNAGSTLFRDFEIFGNAYIG